MFLGHFAVALAARQAAPKTSLGMLVVAGQFIDLLWPVLLLLGVERVAIDPGNTRMTPLDFEHYPISHSLLAVLGWGALLGAAWLLLRRDRRGALVIALLVVSHWLLDFLTHAPDLPLAPGRARVGLGLWNYPAATLLVEVGLFALGVWRYARTTRAADRTGRWAFWSFTAFLAVVYFANLTAPPPPSVTAIAWAGLALWLLPLWAWWFDRHRTLTGNGTP